MNFTKTEVEVTASGSFGVLFTSVRRDEGEYRAVLPLNAAPVRLTAKAVLAVCKDHGVDLSGIVTVYTSSIGRSDYWDYTAHKVRFVEYKLDGDKLVKIRDGGWTS